ncbi:MAG: hypothetical protein EPO27_09710 [Betaproteobacteria bacterium]|nr:MAG: hypothetical protein EPO27_09710 [Betaproteobacteria bacterium]
MKPFRALIATGMLLGSLSAPTFARVDVSFVIGVPPPAPIVEVVPVVRPGYVWVPGYWTWHRDRHIWIRGQWVVERPGYVWVPDRWVQSGPRWQLHRGYWDRRKAGRGHAYGHVKHDRRDRHDRRGRRD